VFPSERELADRRLVVIQFLEHFGHSDLQQQNGRTDPCGLRV
jgi:hypothetical protein